MVRFHGHSDDWESGDKQEKFRYAYGEEELRRWAGLLTELAGQRDELHVLFNNCCDGQAQRDAARLAALLGDSPPTGTASRPRTPVPARLARAATAVPVSRAARVPPLARTTEGTHG